MGMSHWKDTYYKQKTTRLKRISPSGLMSRG